MEPWSMKWDKTTKEYIYTKQHDQNPAQKDKVKSTFQIFEI